MVAVLAGIPLLRLKGPQFSIATMAMTECTRYIFINWEALGGCATVFGSIVGATVLTYISQNTRVWFGGTGTGIDLILYGAHRLTSGRISFRGQNITRLSAHDICRCGVGRTFQIPQSLNQMTVLENALVGSVPRAQHVQGQKKRRGHRGLLRP